MPAIAMAYPEGLAPGNQRPPGYRPPEAEALGVSFASISDTLSRAMGSLYVNDFPNAGRCSRSSSRPTRARMQVEDILKPTSATTQAAWCRWAKWCAGQTVPAAAHPLPGLSRCDFAGKPRRAFQAAKRWR